MATSHTDVHSLERLRPLGKLEQFSSARHNLGFFLNVGLSAAYASRHQEGSILKDVIFSALDAVIERHPILSAIPVDEDTTSPYFACLTSIDLSEAVTFITLQGPNGTLKRQDVDAGEREFSSCRNSELDALLEREHNKSFKHRYGELPFWRLLIITEPKLVSVPPQETQFIASFIFHHALGDGKSGLIFHQDFLRALNTSSLCSKVRNTIITSAKANLLPSLEEALALSHPSKPTPSSQQPPQHPPNHNLWTGAPIDLPLKSCFKSLHLPHYTTQNLLRACKAQNTTLTATLPLLISEVLFSLLPSTCNALESTIPVNLRPKLVLMTPGTSGVVSGESMGTYIDAFSLFHYRHDDEEGGQEEVEVGGDKWWEEARRLKRDIVAFLGSDVINVAKFAKISNFHDFFNSKINTERTSSFDVSNLGLVPVPATAVNDKEDQEEKEGCREWTQGMMLFSRSAFVSGSAFSTGVVTGADGCLSLGFVWQQSVVREEMMELVIKHVMEGIEKIATCLSSSKIA